jgi:hypothetical protein
MAGVTTLSLLVVLFVGTIVGALVGLALGGTITHFSLLAIVAGLAATIAATSARNVLVFREIGVGPSDAAIPTIVLLYAGIASVVGSLAGLEVALLLHEPFPVWIGALSGLLSSILMGLLMITYHMHCDRPVKSKL